MDSIQLEKVRKFEEFVDLRLKPDLVHAIAQRDKVFAEQKNFSDLRRNIENLEKNSVSSLRTLVNLGSEIYMQADVCEASRVFCPPLPPTTVHRQQEMKEQDINRCQIQEWFPKFKSVSIKTIIHELPHSFVQYLLDDSDPFLLPLSISNDDALPNRIHKPDEEEDFVALEGSGDEAEEPTLPPSFPELEMDIKASIESLGGSVFPKLNWTAPKDSAWISTTQNLKCTNFSEIALLLGSSDSIVNDLCHAYDSCSDKTSSRPSSFFLALRKWYPSLKPEMEFRCFVRHKQLVGVCQREVTNFYPALVERKKDLKLMIQEFFLKEVEGKFESESYTFDVYVTRDGTVKLFDFNPWGAFTLPLLFTWEELEENLNEDDNELEFKTVDNRCGIRPGLKTAVPYDYLDTSSGSGWDEFLRNADEKLRQQTSFSKAGA